MSTILQENLAKEIVINATRKKPKNKKELLVLGGYSKTVAETKPQEIMNQKGVKDALRDLGLTEDLIAESLVYDIKNKPKSRVKELGLGAEILGMKVKENTPPPVVTNYTQIIINAPNGQDSSNQSNS